MSNCVNAASHVTKQMSCLPCANLGEICNLMLYTSTMLRLQKTCLGFAVAHSLWIVPHCTICQSCHSRTPQQTGKNAVSPYYHLSAELTAVIEESTRLMNRKIIEWDR